MNSYTRRIRLRRSNKDLAKNAINFYLENKEIIEQRALHTMGLTSIVMAVFIFVQGVPLTLKVILYEIIPVFIETWRISNG